ncbi:uncharacterized protein LOC118200361 [Stegodyphus dumicola]|uniref:uncharacterized protein LOC118200361 n=1 Tax=Stegodyphus dumicola TaxID=202533 RepID=UPI0015AD899B|nr:uncharacterized protein LOC118200361 [Stegodyphus dumicola]
MEEACCGACHQRLMLHNRCCTNACNAHLRRPNFISGYTGKIPINLRWTGDEHPSESRDFLSRCRAPVNNFYVVHCSQYLPDGTLELPKISSKIPDPLRHAIASYVNHPQIRGGSVICHHIHPVDKMTFPCRSQSGTVCAYPVFN